MKVLQITSCSDPMMWYSDKIGEEVPFIREEGDYFWSREPAGYANIVRKKDAVIINKDRITGNKTVMVTGGAGYLGSKLCVELLERGYNVIIFDNLINSSKQAIDDIEEKAGIKPTFIKGDVKDLQSVAMALHTNDIDVVIHLAGINIGDTQVNALSHLDNNVSGTINLMRCMEDACMYNLVIGSTCDNNGTVCGKIQSMRNDVIRISAEHDKKWLIANIKCLSSSVVDAGESDSHFKNVVDVYMNILDIIHKRKTPENLITVVISK